MTSKSRKSNAATKMPRPLSRPTSLPAAAPSGSKAAAVIALLKRDGGATLEEIVSATGWQKHSVRGFMAGALKKRHGLTVTSNKTDHGRSYRVDNEAQ